MEKSIYDDENRLLALLLREVRKEAGISQKELVGRLDCYHSYVSKYELGERRLDIVELRRICEALEKNFIEFIAYYDQECANLPRSLIRDRNIRERL